MRLPKVAISFAALALALTACGDPDEGTTDAFNTKTSGMEESSEAEASTNMTAADMPQTSTTDPSTSTTDPSTSTTDPSTSTSTTTSTTGGGSCGNGTIDMGEQCDGGNLNGFTCVDLGFSGGTLACDSVTCTYDSSSCTTNPGTTG